MKILFQGDSITDAYRRPDEHNPAFQLGNGYAFLIAARLARANPALALEFINRGISGNRLADLRVRWESDAIDLRPDVLSLLIGVNETIIAMRGRECLSVPEFRSLYRSLLDDLRKSNPAVRFILLEPFVLETGIVTKAWRQHLEPRQEVVSELAEEFQAIFVPLQAPFDQAAQAAPHAFWIWDGIHPSHAGFQLMADAWLAAATANDLLTPPL